MELGDRGRLFNNCCCLLFVCLFVSFLFCFFWFCFVGSFLVLFVSCCFFVCLFVLLFYLLLPALELQTRCILPQHLKTPSVSKDSFNQELMDDDCVQVFWCVLSVDIANCDEASELLQSFARRFLH